MEWTQAAAKHQPIAESHASTAAAFDRLKKLKAPPAAYATLWEFLSEEARVQWRETVAQDLGDEGATNAVRQVCVHSIHNTTPTTMRLDIVLLHRWTKRWPSPKLQRQESLLVSVEELVHKLLL